LKEHEEVSAAGQPETPARAMKSKVFKVFNVALDSITSESPQFAQVLIPIPLSADQKKRLIDFLQSL